MTTSSTTVVFDEDISVNAVSHPEGRLKFAVDE